MNRKISSDVFEIDWNLMQGFIVISWLWFWHCFSRFFPYNFLEENLIPKSVVLQIGHGYIFICWFSFWYLFFHYVLFHYRRLIIINILSNCLDESIFIEITLHHECSLETLLHIFRTPLEDCFRMQDFAV